MGRYTGPKVKLSRREGVDLNLKGAKSLTEKNPLKRKPQAPGQHGFSRKRLSGYGTQLREKQKVKRMYGIYEKQFRNYYEKASKSNSVTGEELLSLLERRLDNVIYRSGVASTRAQARKLVGQKKFKLNGKDSRTPSISVKKGDKITIDSNLKFSIPEEFESPAWLSFNGKDTITIVALPVRDDITDPISEQLIVEYYSR